MRRNFATLSHLTPKLAFPPAPHEFQVEIISSLIRNSSVKRTFCQTTDDGCRSRCRLTNSSGFSRPLPLKIAYVLAAVLGMYLVIGAAAQIVCNLIGFAYPAYASVKAVRSKQTDDDTQWLVYWCVFATFSLMDFFAGSVMQWFPLYWLMKAMILIILFLPQTMGAQFLFTTYVDPLVTAIDDFCKKSKEEE